MKIGTQEADLYDNLHSFYRENLAQFIQKWYDLGKQKIVKRCRMPLSFV